MRAHTPYGHYLGPIALEQAQDLWLRMDHMRDDFIVPVGQKVLDMIKAEIGRADKGTTA